MINGDEEINIHHITEEQFEEDIQQRLFNCWYECGFPDIITEYFGNQSIFEPSLNAFIHMIIFITDRRREIDMDALPIDDADNNFRIYANILRHYAYWYIYDLGYEDFLLTLEKYVAELDTDSNTDSGSECECECEDVE